MQALMMGNTTKCAGRSFHLTCDPYLIYHHGMLLFTATATRLDYEYRLYWNLTPAYIMAIERYISADERDEIVQAVIEDLDGAAEWDEPLFFES
jgi:hypothetical protein